MNDEEHDTDRQDITPGFREGESTNEYRERMDRVEAEQAEKVRERRERRGILIVNGGDGKGKSTAAFGMAIRAAGHGQRVGVVQFIKGNWKTGEQRALARFPEIDHVISGEGFTWKTKSREKDIAAAQRGWNAACEMIRATEGDGPKYKLIVLDEINIALRYDYLDLDQVIETLLSRSPEQSIVCTGRDPRPKLVEVADTVTEMHCVRHAFERGIKARKGVDF